MKRILNIFVVVITCFCILTATTAPAFAAGFDDEEGPSPYIEFVDENGEVLFVVDAETFDPEDYLIPYDVYYQDYPITPYNAAVGVMGYAGGLAWSSAFAEIGAVCSTGGMFILGVLLAGGLLYAVNGLYETITTDVPQVFYDTVSLIYMNSDEATREWLEEAFNLYVEGEAITVTPEISEAIVAAMAGDISTDSAGNVVDTSISIPATAIGGVYADSFPAKISTSKMKAYQLLLATPYNGTYTMTVSNDFLSWSSDGKAMSSVLTNTLTGSSLTFSNRMVNTRASNTEAQSFCYMSMPFQVAINDFTYWTAYFGGYKYATGWADADAFQYSKISSTYPISFTGTGTILDNKTIVSVAWDSVSSAWMYTFDDGESTVFPMDPFGLVISKTGSLTTGTTVKPEANDEDKTVVLPHPGIVPGFKNPTVGIPFDDTYIDNVVPDVVPDTEVVPAVKPIQFENRNDIINFLNRITEYFTGLFDWLPDDFIDLLDSVWVALQWLIVAMTIVKIIDIVWP